MDTLLIPGVPLITYTPSAAGEITAVSAASGQGPVTSATYNAAGQLSSLTYGSGDSDSYNSQTGRMSKYQLSVNGQTDTGTLTWNADGTLASLDISDPFDAGDTQSCSFTQDDLGRLSEVNCGSEWLQNFTTDQYADVAVTGAGNSDPFSASFANDRISSVNGFAPSYDADGNLEDNPLTQTRNVYSWDAEGRPVEVDGASQAYDAFGRLVYNSTSPAEYAWTPDGRKAANMNGQSMNFAEVGLPGGASAMYANGGLWYYAHPDWLGSWRLASSPSRAETGDLAYSPYGAAYAGTGPDAFTGQWVDTPDNLNDFQHRLLAPMMDRWLSPDPAGLAAVNPANPQTWNAYAYVANQPLSATDSTGLFCTTGHCPWNISWTDYLLGLPDGPGGIVVPPPLSPTLLLGSGGGGGGIAPETVPITGKIHLQGPACVSAASINAFLAGNPLEGQGQNFYSAGQQYDVNPALAVAIADAESSLGRNVNATWGFHNAWGWGAVQPYRAEAQGWTSWAQGISVVTAQLADRLYMGNRLHPLTTTAAIYGQWCQSGNCAAGLQTVDTVLGDLGVSPSSLRFKACAGSKQ